MYVFNTRTCMYMHRNWRLSSSFGQCRYAVHVLHFSQSNAWTRAQAAAVYFTSNLNLCKSLHIVHVSVCLALIETILTRPAFALTTLFIELMMTLAVAINGSIYRVFHDGLSGHGRHWAPIWMWTRHLLQTDSQTSTPCVCTCTYLL